MKKTKLCAGDWIEVRSKEEILATLDQRGQLDGMPFMPEMFQSCGRRFRVWKRAHKTCDTVLKTGGRWVKDAVHLEELRCDGMGHGGCQAACLLFWKTNWLKPAAAPSGREQPANPAPAPDRPTKAAPSCREEDVFAGTRAEGLQVETDPTYACQATRLPYFTTPLPWWDPRQYWEDCSSGNVGLGRVLSSFLFWGYYLLTQLGFGGPTLRRIYDKFQNLRDGPPFPIRMGLVPSGQPTPTCTLNLQPGELVRIKSHQQILATLDMNSKNRGLYFDKEEVPYCNKTYRVRSRVDRIIDERTGKMLPLKTESVILEGVYCQARYSDRRLFCPRAIYPMWREVWLDRVEQDGSGNEESKPVRDPI